MQSRNSSFLEEVEECEMSFRSDLEENVKQCKDRPENLILSKCLEKNVKELKNCFSKEHLRFKEKPDIWNIMFSVSLGKQKYSYF